MVTFAANLLQMRFEPFNTRELNQMEQFSLLLTVLRSCIACLASTCLFTRNSLLFCFQGILFTFGQLLFAASELSAGVRTLITVFLVIDIVLFVVGFIIRSGILLWRERKRTQRAERVAKESVEMQEVETL